MDVDIVNIDGNHKEFIKLDGFVPHQGDVIQTIHSSYIVLYRSFCTVTNTLRLYVREEK